MIYRNIILSIIIVLSAFGLAAQNQARVHLQNGSYLRGEVIEYNYGDTLKLLVNGQHLLKIPESHIKSLKFGTTKSVDPPSDFNNKKIINTTRVAIDVGQTAMGYSLTHSVSWRIHRNLYAGVGGGFDNYYQLEDFNVFPLFAEVRYYVLDRGPSPFINLRVGNGFAFPNKSNDQFEADGGLHFNPSVGFRFGKKFFYTEITGGVKFQKLHYLYIGNENTSDYDILVKRLNLGLNFTF